LNHGNIVFLPTESTDDSDNALSTTKCADRALPYPQQASPLNAGPL